MKYYNEDRIQVKLGYRPPPDKLSEIKHKHYLETEKRFHIFMKSKIWCYKIKILNHFNSRNNQTAIFGFVKIDFVCYDANDIDNSAAEDKFKKVITNAGFDQNDIELNYNNHYHYTHIRTLNNDYTIRVIQNYGTVDFQYLFTINSKVNKYFGAINLSNNSGNTLNEFINGFNILKKKKEKNAKKFSYDNIFSINMFDNSTSYKNGFVSNGIKTLPTDLNSSSNLYEFDGDFFKIESAMHGNGPIYPEERFDINFLNHGTIHVINNECIKVFYFVYDEDEFVELSGYIVANQTIVEFTTGSTGDNKKETEERLVKLLHTIHII